MGVYPGVDVDLDVNAFSTKDMKQLTLSGMGGGLKEMVGWTDVIVAILLITIVITALLSYKFFFKNFFPELN